MKKFTRIWILLLAIVLAFSFTGCGKKQENTQTAQVSVTEAPAAPVQTQEPENTQTPAATQTPEITEEPSETEAPAETEEPSVPETTETPVITEEPAVTEASSDNGITVEEDGQYTDKDHVALYLHTYGHLPSNYITKNDARAAGWDSGAGNLITVCPGMSIGGDRYGNYEGLLPKAKGRQYYECDIDYNPKGKTSGKVTRGPKRIVFSNDGLIFYTEDHYNTFEQLY